MPALRRWVDDLFTVNPWAGVYAAGRSLIALPLLLTLLVNPAGVLFAPNPGLEPLKCDGIVGRAGLFCVVPVPEAGRWIGIVILVVVVSGWRPRWTALPHAWVAVSMQSAMSVVEGGDQIAANLAVLLLPLAMLDGRRWHWPGAGENRGIGAGETGRMIANTTMTVIRLQVCVIYLHAAVGKLAVPEWLDGTAMYYWASEPLFGPDGLRGAVFGLVVGTAVGTTLLTWGTIVLEFTLAAGLVAAPPMRKGLFWAGTLLHVGIAVMLGLVAFGITMVGALLLYLWPRGEPLPGTSARRRAAAWKRGRTADDPLVGPVEAVVAVDIPPAAARQP